MLHDSIVHIYKTGTSTGTVSIITAGRVRGLEFPALIAKQIGCSLSHVIMPPKDASQPGFQTIIVPRLAEHGPDVQVSSVDGMALDPGSLGMIQSKDCPILVLVNTCTGRTVFAHAGRPAMTSSLECGSCYYTVINPAVKNALSEGGVPDDLRAYIVAGICQDCFEHDGADADQHLEHFRTFHQEMLTGPRSCLDLIGVIHKELTAMHGIAPEHITHDGLCTRCDGRLASKRGGDTDHNIVLVASR